MRSRVAANDCLQTTGHTSHSPPPPFRSLSLVITAPIKIPDSLPMVQVQLIDCTSLPPPLSVRRLSVVTTAPIKIPDSLPRVHVRLIDCTNEALESLPFLCLNEPNMRKAITLSNIRRYWRCTRSVIRAVSLQSTISTLWIPWMHASLRLIITR